MQKVLGRVTAVSFRCHGGRGSFDRANELAIALILVSTGCAGGGASDRPASEGAATTVARSSTSAKADLRPGREVEFAITGPHVQPECSPGCVVPYTQVGTVTGSLTGGITGAGAVGLDGSRYTGATTFVFRGRVEGCGEGALALRRREAGDLRAKTLRGTWDITAGFGTGSLATVAGEGTIAAPETEPAAGDRAAPRAAQ